MKKRKGVKPKKRNDVVLLEDLAPRKDVKGGARKIVFGAGGDLFSEAEEEKKGKKK